MTVAGRRDTLPVSKSSSDNVILLILSIDAPESTINCLSSGLRIEVECYFPIQLRSPCKFREACTTVWPTAKLHLLHHLQPATCCLDLFSASEGALAVAMMFRPTLDHSQRLSHLFVHLDESVCSFRVSEFKMCSRRSLAALPQDGQSDVRRSNRLLQQFDILRYTTQCLNTAYNCSSRLLRCRVFFDVCLALHCVVWMKKHTFVTKFTIFIRLFRALSFSGS